ncbi:MAG: DUF4097 domain-containing protein [Flavobacteriaceae bacterium]|nr:DUF4097 domain-containing protein [Flavobacteriaceae bacterium]
MKNAIIFVCALLFSNSTFAQKQVEESVPISGASTLFAHFKFADTIEVKHSSEKVFKVKAIVSLDQGKGDHFFSLKTKREDGALKIYSDFGNYFKDRKQRNDCNNPINIQYEIYVPRNSKLRIKTISGDVGALDFQGTLITDLVSGDITIKKYQGKLRLETVSGDIDVASQQANVEAGSVTGTIYSNHDITYENENRSRSQNKVTGTIGGGGKQLKLKTVSGNIYIRKM